MRQIEPCACVGQRAGDEGGGALREGQACGPDRGDQERAAAGRFGINARTVSKMLKFSVPPGYVRTKPPFRPKLDEFTPLVPQRLIAAINAGPQSNWLLTMLGRLSPTMVRQALHGTPLLERLEPLLLLAPGGNWLSSEESTLNLAFLLKQSL